MGKCSQTNGLLSFYWISTTAMRGSAVRTTQVWAFEYSAQSHLKIVEKIEKFGLNEIQLVSTEQHVQVP